LSITQVHCIYFNLIIGQKVKTFLTFNRSKPFDLEQWLYMADNELNPSTSLKILGYPFLKYSYARYCKYIVEKNTKTALSPHCQQLFIFYSVHFRCKMALHCS